jgi:uncharacterized protein (UPF0333 family)
MTHIGMAGAPLLVTAALMSACTGSDKSESAAMATGRADSAASTAAAKPAVRRVSNVMIGKHIGSNNMMTEPTFQFTPQETVYVSVATEGAQGPDALTAAWRSQNGEVVQKTSETIKPGENTVFRLAQPKGLKPGTYKVVLFLGDDSVDTKLFAVKK